MNKSMPFAFIWPKGLLALVAVSMLSGTALAQDADEHDTAELAKKLSNPVAALISVPFQLNTDFNIGPEDGTRTSLVMQPVIPASINEDWNLITRIVAPLVTQNDVAGKSGTQSGLGDTTPSFFFSPKAPTASGLIWGLGPVFLLPTATDDRLGGEKWGLGPTGVLLKQTPDGWTYGILANHIWSVGGNSNRADISNTYLQPFLTKAVGHGGTWFLNSESSYDWKTQKWTAPFNFGYAQIMKWGSQLVQVKAGVRGYATTPGQGPDWGVRLELDLLYPK